jgi:hypothetical protein
MGEGVAVGGKERFGGGGGWLYSGRTKYFLIMIILRPQSQW